MRCSTLDILPGVEAVLEPEGAVVELVDESVDGVARLPAGRSAGEGGERLIETGLHDLAACDDQPEHGHGGTAPRHRVGAGQWLDEIREDEAQAGPGHGSPRFRGHDPFRGVTVAARPRSAQARSGAARPTRRRSRAARPLVPGIVDVGASTGSSQRHRGIRNQIGPGNRCRGLFVALRRLARPQRRRPGSWTWVTGAGWARHHSTTRSASWS